MADRFPVQTGQKYRFIYTLDEGRSYYATVGQLVSTTKESYVLSLRPTAGTAYLAKRYVTRIENVPADTHPRANARWRGATHG